MKKQSGPTEAATPKSKKTVKSGVKPAAPPLPPTPAKSTATKTAQPTAEVSAAAKSPAKASVQTAAKPPVKAPAKAVSQANTPAAAPPPAKPVKTTAPDKEKDFVKTMTDQATKAETAAKPKAARVPAPSASKTPAQPAATVKAAVPLAVPAPVAAPVKPVVAEPAPSASGVPVRAGRPSSRLAQLTVPSMAQSVASTAAKASYAKIVTLPPIAPPLASAVKKDPKLANNWKTTPIEQLSDAELMAMPDDEYMNDTQMAYFRLKLSRLKADILSSAGATTEHLREDTVVVPDPADRATIEEEHALELRTRDRERKLLKKIEQSIARIDAGDYGYCDETGEAIGVGRLLARPTASLSLEAQQRRELKQKMFGD